MVFEEAGVKQDVLHMRKQEERLPPVISPSWLSAGDTGTPGSTQLSNRKTRDMKYFQSCLQRVIRPSVRGVKPLTLGQDPGEEKEGRETTFRPSQLLPTLGTVTVVLLLAGVAGGAAAAAMIEGMERMEGSRGTRRTLEMPKELRGS